MNTNLEVLPAETTDKIMMPNPAWQRARQYLEAAQRFEQCKVFSQVMLGFELTALRKEFAVKHGGDRKSINFPNGKLIPNGGSWTELLEENLGISHSTAYRFIEMAKAAAPRLKKLPALQDLPLLECSVNEFTESQRNELEQATHKLTDGRTQMEFAMAMGICKKPAHGKGGDTSAHRKKLSPAAALELERDLAREDWAQLGLLLRAYASKFTLLPDSEIEAQAGELQRAFSARRQWVATPEKSRDLKTAQKHWEA